LASEVSHLEFVHAGDADADPKLKAADGEMM
jgi:hypothetical protein